MKAAALVFLTSLFSSCPKGYPRTEVYSLHSLAMDPKPDHTVSHYEDADNKESLGVNSSTEMKIDVRHRLDYTIRGV